MDPEPCTNDVHKQVLQKVLQNTFQQVSSKKVSDLATECCVICLGELAEPCEAQPCRHKNFDFLCLVTWLEKRPTCPLCKSNVIEVRYGLDDDGMQVKVYKVPEQSEQRGDSTQLSGRRNSDASDFGQHTSWLFDDEVTWRRRSVYRNKLYSLHMGFNRRQASRPRYRELRPQDFMSDPELVSRARTWLSRELRVFEFLFASSSPSHGHSTSYRSRPTTAEYLLEYIIAILKSIDTQGSTGQAEKLIQEFLGRDNTRLFLHELRTWLRSPFDSLEEWDRAIQYPESSILPQPSFDANRVP